MQYISAHLWQKGSRDSQMRVSLILQQAKVRKKSVLLACVCEGKNEGEVGVTESGYFTEGLVEWFHKEGVKLCERKSVEEEIGKALETEVVRMQGEIAHYLGTKKCKPELNYWGILIWDNCFWIFNKGDCRGYLLNRRFQKKNMRDISNVENTEMAVIFGRLQRRLGLLICTSGFLKHLNREEITEVLMPEGEVTEDRLQKRMQELWGESVKRGGDTSVGAICLNVR